VTRYCEANTSKHAKIKAAATEEIFASASANNAMTNDLVVSTRAEIKLRSFCARNVSHLSQMPLFEHQNIITLPRQVEAREYQPDDQEQMVLGPCEARGGRARCFKDEFRLGVYTIVLWRFDVYNNTYCPPSDAAVVVEANHHLFRLMAIETAERPNA
jgi:hypothetical protein